MKPVLPSLAANLDNNLLAASIPLFREERVAALEWSFDALYSKKEIPDWFTELLTLYGAAERLIGHGVFFSLFSGKWLPEQERWLQQLRSLSGRFSFDHITEHFGFMTGSDFHKGAPLNVPLNAKTLAIGRDRLSRIQDACCCPVGLENLAFSTSLDEVKRHGNFLHELILPLNGFIILDLHNLYCQLHNFSVDFDTLVRLYPLERVREIHISGGSWEPSAAEAGRMIRRDTHDDRVPTDVFNLLEAALPLCPQLKFVVLEQLGTALETENSRLGFYNDFLTMEAIVSRHNLQLLPALSPNNFLPWKKTALPGMVMEDDLLYDQQKELSRILETAQDYRVAIKMLQASEVSFSDWHIENWDPSMLQTAINIAQKWKNGWQTDIN